MYIPSWNHVVSVIKHNLLREDILKLKKEIYKKKQDVY
jgi:hypothetical protein